MNRLRFILPRFFKKSGSPEGTISFIWHIPQDKIGFTSLFFDVLPVQ